MSMSKTKKLKPAIAYIRVSTEQQEETGYGLELQMTRIKAYAREAGYELVDVPFRDVQTGVGEDSIEIRQGLRDAFQAAARMRCPIIVDDLSRIARNTAKLEDIVLRGKIRITSAKSGEGASHAVLMVEAARAQEEAERISRTTKEGLERARAAGKVLGNRTNLEEARKKAVAKNQEKAERQIEDLPRVIPQLQEAGKKAAAEIAEALNLLDIKTPRGQPWSADNIRRPLRQVEQRRKQRQHEENINNPNWGIF